MRYSNYWEIKALATIWAKGKTFQSVLSDQFNKVCKLL